MNVLKKIWLGKITVYLSVILVITIFSGCRQSDEDLQDFEKWTSNDPLAVNYRTRHNKYIAGNLIENPSFEMAKKKRNLSDNKPEIIEGWEIIGKDVKWIDLSDSLQSNKNSIVHSGRRSVLIKRIQADETEEMGQGVLSDFIKVIPGNYRLNLFLNLKDIKNPKSRLGTKIYDAVDIRIIYYDRNKLQINGAQFSAHYNQKINSGFKGVSFSNFEKIDSTGWLHINGYSHIFPFADGDIPDETKFVKIFIGLKGTGSLWVDDISYKYTNQNLTISERLSDFFDTTYAKARILIPQPKKVKILESEIYYKNAECPPYIILPANANNELFLYAQILERKIIDLLVNNGQIEKGHFKSIIKKSVDEIKGNYSILFSIGESDIFRKYKSVLPIDKISQKGQGYFIHTVPMISDIVFIYGNSDESTYYALQTALQLFDSKSLLFHNANIIDYPDEEIRSLLITGMESKKLPVDFTNNLRFNRVYLPAELLDCSDFKKPERPVQPYLYFNMKEDQKVDFNQLNNVLKTDKNCLSGCAFLFGNLVSANINLEQALKNYYDRNCYNSDNYNSFIENLSRLASNHLNIEILPPDNVISDSESAYSNLNFLWSGRGLQSWQMDESLISINSREAGTPGFIDFSLYPKSKSFDYFGNDRLNPYKNMTSCLFEPYNNEIVQEIYNNTGNTILVYSFNDILDKIRIKTASDFYWNRNNYNADFTLFKVLISEFGIEAAYDVLKFNDFYFEARAELVLAADKKNFHKNVRKAYQSISELNKVEKRLKTKYSNSSLNELNSIFAILISELEQKKNNLGYVPMLQ